MFDIKIEAQKKNAYTKLSQNELALQFYQAGFMLPQNADVALTTLDMMDFEGKDRLIQKIANNAAIYQQMLQYRELAIALAQKYRPDIAAGLMESEDMEQTAAVSGGQSEKVELQEGAGEASHVRKAREQSAAASQPV